MPDACYFQEECTMKRLSALPNRRFLRQPRLSAVAAALVLAGIGVAPPTALAATVTNPICPTEFALFNPDNGSAIVVPPGFKVSVFKAGLNFPTGIAFKGNSQSFEVYVLESGHGLPSICNEQGSIVGGTFSPTNPFTPDILLFASDSNQATHAAGQNNSSRIVTVDPVTGNVTPFITGLPTGDHPTEQFAFDGKWIYWSQGSTTNSGVVGRDNGGGANQQDI